MTSDEENKDGRYFPGQEELSILINSIEEYFSYPERSEERSKIVSSVTGRLNAINAHWKNRSVRLWFNNNKKTYLKQEANVTFVPIPESPLLNAGTKNQFYPPKKRVAPPRSSSVSQFDNFFSPGISPSLSLTSKSLSSILKSPRKTVEEQKEVELHITQQLVSNHSKYWLNHIAQIELNRCIVAYSSMPPEFSKNPFPDRMQNDEYIYDSSEYSEFDLIECGIANANGYPAIICYNTSNQTHEFRYKEGIFDLGLSYPASSLAYDSPSDTFFFTTGTLIKTFNPKEGLLNTVISPRTMPLHHSPLLCSNNRVILGSRSKFFVWNQSEFEDVNNMRCLCFEANLPLVTSMAAADTKLALASHNHHAIHMFDSQFNFVSSLIGHGAGVTSLCSSETDNLISGSADLTARLWDLRLSQPAIQFERHLGSITSLAYANTQSSKIVITGGEDHIVRGWDIRASAVLFEINCGTGVPISLDFDQNKVLTIITKEKTQTDARGFSLQHNKDISPVISVLSPNLSMKVSLGRQY